MHIADPCFPPLLTAEGVNAPNEPFAEACRRAALGRLEAGDCLWARNTARAALAVVLEPEVPLAHAIQMGPLMQAAVVDALGALMPPQVAVTIRWPNLILLNGGVAGRTRIAAPRDTPADAVPDWLVVGFELVVSSDGNGREPGEDAGRTTVAEEGASDLDRTRILESVAAHFLTWLDTWSEDGFRGLGEHWIGRVDGYGANAIIAHAGGTVEGRVLGLADAVSLIVRLDDGSLATLPLIDNLERYAPGART
ncbi:MAG: biotin/lipoate--protein ligase family protein [Hyphomicrobiaceae bacterium]